MTQEDKELLIRDLCSRLPYGVKCLFENSIETIKGIWYDEDEDWQIDGDKTSTCIHAVKPYLFPISNMTIKQKIECFKGTDIELDEHNEIWSKCPTCIEDVIFTNIREWLKVINYLNVNHFDYKDLIKKGLAIDATNTNVYD